VGGGRGRERQDSRGERGGKKEVGKGIILEGL
jgi:hypothetical protein